MKNKMIIRHDWTFEEIERLFQLPFMDLIYKAMSIHAVCFKRNAIQKCTLLNIKTGGCPEDCAYCPQSAHYKTGLKKEPLMDIADIMKAANQAKEQGATRFCMGAAWRSPPQKSYERILDIIKAVKNIGLETCATLGMLNKEFATALQAAGLDYYNHNIDTSSKYYKKIINTRTFQDRLETLRLVQQAGIKVCCGGIVGMGETEKDRILFCQTLANLPDHPKSVPINLLIPIQGTPLGDLKQQSTIDPFDFVRVIAITRILMPQAYVRLSAGRESMSDELQVLCFMAGANSIFIGDKLLTTSNPTIDKDIQLFNRLGLT